VIAQGYERQPAMNCLGLYLFTQLLPAFEGHGEEFAPEFSACNLGQFSGRGRHGDAMEPPGGMDMSLVMAAIADDNVNSQRLRLGFRRASWCGKSGTSGSSASRRTGSAQDESILCTITGTKHGRARQ
jgi:hypothetical protein